jgi:predicted metalloprotease with PDZ domain
VRWNGPSDKARLAPGERIIAVNGKIYSADALKAAIRETKTSAEPLHLIVQADVFVSTVDVDYHGGERYPALERAGDVPAYLDEISKPLTVPEKAPAAPNSDEE